MAPAKRPGRARHALRRGAYDPRTASRFHPHMRLPRKLLLTVWPVLTLLAYYLILFTTWGNYYSDNPQWTTVVFDASVVLAAAASWEVVRTERCTPLRALAGAVGFPLTLFVLASLWYGVQPYLPA